MQIVIDTMQCPCRTLSDECDISHNECYEDDICSSCPLIRNGGVKLPKGHGDLKDMNEFINILKGFEVLFSNDELRCSLLDAIKNVPTIIEADNESEE